MNVTNDLRLLFLSDGCPVELAWCFPLHYIQCLSTHSILARNITYFVPIEVDSLDFYLD